MCIWRSLVEDDDAHMKVSLGCGEMGLSAHLQASKTGNTRFFTSNTHSSVVLQGFDQLRIEGLLCDVTLVAGDGDEAFPVHRAMMASSSDYFKAMFTGGMKEQDLMCIKLHGVNRIGLKKIIDFIYTAKLSLNMENLQDTLEAASFLQILPVLDFCKVFLISGVSLENCVEVGRIASAYNLAEVDKYVNNFILKNFPALLGTGEFVKLPVERLAFALSSNGLRRCSELELFKAACRWLRAEDGRMEHAARLMRNVRFPLMSPSELINHVQTVDFMRTDNACVNLLLEASNYQMMPYMQPVMQSERTAIRSDSAHLVTLGGVLRQQLVVSKELRLFDEKAHEWRALAPMDAPRYQHGIAVIGNFLYVVGGQSNYDTKGKTAVDTAFRYDPRYNRWIQVACLNEKRTFFHLSALKGHLYAVGGRNAAGELGE
ncbi:kelch-like protein 13 isoform X3 [Tachysurus ichikawai]